jgi:orotidine-5'-phosphate decarboxylase
MTRDQLVEQIRIKKSFLCVGLDSDLSRIPKHLLSTDDPVFEFNKAIIDATKDYCIAYKPNIAFYESLGSKGWDALGKTIDYIPDTHFTIADAKRGDIGNTSRQYAKTFFETFEFDSITVAPYMGIDSVSPFLEYENKWVILLALTSNKGSEDFQHCGTTPLYEKVITRSQEWGTPENLMYVIGATHPESFARIRELAPEHFYLVPGVGAQGGSVSAVCTYGKNNDVGLLINSSRGIIFSSEGEDFAEMARQSAKRLHIQMKEEFSA